MRKKGNHLRDEVSLADRDDRPERSLPVPKGEQNDPFFICGGIYEKAILKRYVRHYDELKLLGSLPLGSTFTIEKLCLTPARIQSGYRDIRKIKFPGSLLDYLCLVSTEYLICLSRQREPLAVAQWIFDNYESQKENANNLLRLFKRDHRYFYKLLNFTGDQKPSFHFLLDLWLDLVNRDHPDLL